MTAPRTRRDEGVALVMALVAIVVFATIAAAVAGFAFTSFRNTAAVNNKIDKIAAAESGVRHVFDQLKVYSGSCPPAPLLYQPTVNDLQVQVTCGYDGGGPATGTQWALVVLGDPGQIEDFLSQGGTKIVSGPVYLDYVPTDLDNSTGSQTLVVRDGFVQARDCETGTVPDWLQFRVGDVDITDPAQRQTFLRCGGYEYPKTAEQYAAQGLTYPLPPDMTGAPVWSIAQWPVPLPGSTASCKIYGPGVYNNLGEWDLRGRDETAAPDEVWFQPGVYYFFNTRLIVNKAYAKAGMPAQPTDIVIGDSANPPVKRMPTCVPAGTPAGGATFVLGGRSRIAVSGPSARLEVFSGVSPVAELSSVAVMSVPRFDGAGVTTDLWPDGQVPSALGVAPTDITFVDAEGDCSRVNTPTGEPVGFTWPIIRSDAGQNPAFGTTGKLIVPDQKVCLFTTGQDASFQVSGGVISTGIGMGVASGEGLLISATGTELPFRVVVRATAVGGGALGPSVTATAVAEVVTYDPTGGGSPITDIAINSWRVA